MVHAVETRVEIRYVEDKLYAKFDKEDLYFSGRAHTGGRNDAGAISRRSLC